MSDVNTASLLSPRKAAEALGVTAAEMPDLMLRGEIRTVADSAGVMMVPPEAIAEYRHVRRSSEEGEHPFSVGGGT
jgi:hypothetical protein